MLTKLGIKRKMNKLLYTKQKGAIDKELLEIIVLSKKAHYFEFLKDRTEFKVRGAWKKYKGEKNTIIQVQFHDRPDEKIGLELMRLFKEYNKRFVKEEVLYVRTLPIEESTLK